MRPRKCVVKIGGREEAYMPIAHTQKDFLTGKQILSFENIPLLTTI